ncbi:MAG: nucleotide-binding universal stress UspA family protein [Myxococcota bacterium]|jgi:nucleotide-binding universal stress UspA family protein
MRLLVAADIHAPYHEWVVDRARPLARAIGGRVDIAYVGDASEVHKRKLESILELFDAEQQGSVRMQTGNAADVLIGWSEEYDVMMLGPREPSAIERVLRGSVVVKVLRGTKCAVLVPRKPLHGDGPWRVLVGIDINGKFKHEVARMAADWTRHLGGRLDAVYAIADPLPVYSDSQLRARAMREWAAAREPERLRLQAILDEAVPEEVRGDAIIVKGEPEDAVQELSDQYDMIVVGNRDRAGLQRFLFGPVSSAIVRKADCDVLTLPTSTLG